MQAKRVLEYVADPSKFDLVTDRWDSQGMRTVHNKYRKYILNGAEYYERPVNSGNLWFENNQPAGRVLLTFNDKGHIASKEFNFDAEHVAYVAPPTGSQKLAADLEVTKAELAAAQAELAAINKEMEVRTAPINHAPKISKRE